MAQRSKSKLKEPTQIDDLAALDKIFHAPEWKVFTRMVYNRIQYQKDHIVGLPEMNPIKLSINKAYDRGIIAGLLLIIRNVETAAAEMEKLAGREVE